MLFNRHNVKYFIPALIVLILLTLKLYAAAEEQEGFDPLNLILSMRDGYKEVNGYTADLEKAEPIVDNEDHIENIFIKFQKPHKVYMKWIGEQHKGREVVYIEGENDDHFYARPEGFLGFFIKILKLPGNYKTTETRYTVKMVGLGNLINSIVDTTLQAKNNNELTLIYKGVTTRNGGRMHEIERLLPAKSCYPNARLVVFIDTSTHLLREAWAYGPDGKLWEYCKYNNLKINPPLQNIDFSADNKEYGFSYL